MHLQITGDGSPLRTPCGCWEIGTLRAPKAAAWLWDAAGAKAVAAPAPRGAETCPAGAMPVGSSTETGPWVARQILLLLLHGLCVTVLLNGWINGSGSVF